jgi:hypothetical protein
MVGSNDCVTKINNNKKKINEININNNTDTSIQKQKHNIHSQLYTYITASHSQCATQCNAMQCNGTGRDWEILFSIYQSYNNIQNKNIKK